MEKQRGGDRDISVSVKKTLLRIRRQVGESGTGLQFLLLGRMAKAQVKGVCQFTDTGMPCPMPL